MALRLEAFEAYSVVRLTPAFAATSQERIMASRIAKSSKIIRPANRKIGAKIKIIRKS